MVDSRVVAFSVNPVDSVVGSGETVCNVAKREDKRHIIQCTYNEAVTIVDKI